MQFIARMREIRNRLKILVRKPEEKTALDRHRQRQKINVETDNRCCGPDNSTQNTDQ